MADEVSKNNEKKYLENVGARSFMLFEKNLSFQVFRDVTLSRQVDDTRRFEGSCRSHPNHTASHL
jgi:hypothetical protein